MQHRNVTKSPIQNVVNFFKKNIVFGLFSIGIIFVLIVAFFRVTTDNSKTVYARVKVSQGLWWAYTIQPSYWYASSIRPGLTHKSLSGKTIAEILDVRYYPSQNPNEFSVYITVKLQADFNSRTGIYKFERDTLSIASPVAFNFPSVFINGTVLALSESPFQDKYITQTITLNKNIAEPWEDEAIQIGDIYNDGTEQVFEIIDKKVTDTYVEYNSYPVESAPRKNITITGTIKLKDTGHQLLFGEEQIIIPGKTILITTDTFRFQDYKITKIE